MDSRMDQKGLFLICFTLLSLVHNNYGYIAYMPRSLGGTDDPCGPTLDGMRAAGETGLPDSPYIAPPSPGQIPSSSQQNYNAGPGSLYDFTGQTYNGNNFPAEAGSYNQPGNINGQRTADHGSGNVYSVYGGRAQEVVGRNSGPPSPSYPSQPGRRSSAVDPAIKPPSVTYRVTGEVQQRSPGTRQRRVKRQMARGLMTGGHMGPMAGGNPAQQAAMLDYDPPEYFYGQPMAPGPGMGIGQPYMNNYGTVGAGAFGTGTAGMGQPYGNNEMLVPDLPDLPVGFVGPITPQVAALYDVDIPPGSLPYTGAGGPQYSPNQPQYGASMGPNNFPPPGTYEQQLPADPAIGYYNGGSNQNPRPSGQLLAADPYAQNTGSGRGGNRHLQIQPGRIGVEPQPNIRSRGGNQGSRSNVQPPVEQRQYEQAGTRQRQVALNRPPSISSRGGLSVNQPIDPNTFANKQGFKVQPNPALPTFDVGPLPSTGTEARSRSHSPVRKQSGTGNIAGTIDISARNNQPHSNVNPEAAATSQGSQRIATRSRMPLPSISVDPGIVGPREISGGSNTSVQLPRYRPNNNQSSIVNGSAIASSGNARPSSFQSRAPPGNNRRTVNNTSRIALNASSLDPMLNPGAPSKNVNASTTGGAGSIRNVANNGAIDIKAIPVNNRHDAANGKYPPASSLQDHNANQGPSMDAVVRSTGAARQSGTGMKSGSVRLGEVRGSRVVPASSGRVSITNSRASPHSGTLADPVSARDPGASTNIGTVAVSGGPADPVAQDQAPAFQGGVDVYDPYAQPYYDTYDYYNNQWYSDPYYQDPYTTSWNPVYYNFWDQFFGFPLSYAWAGYSSQPSPANQQSTYNTNQWPGDQNPMPQSDPNALHTSSGQLNSASQKQASIQVQAQTNVNSRSNSVQPQSQRSQSNVPNELPGTVSPGSADPSSIFFSPQDPYSQGGAGSSFSVYNAQPANDHASYPQNTYQEYPQDPYMTYPEHSAYPQDPSHTQNSFSAGAQPSAYEPYANVDIYAVPQEPRNCYCELASECTRDASSSGAHYNGQCDGSGNFVCCCRR